MKLAYADPPYIGQAKRHYANDPSGIPAEEVDHVELVNRLLRDYDGWALSASSPTIPYICKIIYGDDPINTPKNQEVRIGVWTKSFCSWKPTHRVQYTYEPVFFKPVRPKGSRNVPSVRDYVCCRMTMKKGVHGAKPPEFCDWVLNLLGYQQGDIVDDLFPGSGAFTQAIERAQKKHVTD